MAKYHYSNDLDAIKQIRKTEGIRGLYRAYGATVASFGPFSALYFLFYENLKGMIIANDPKSYLERKDQAKAKADLSFF